MSRNSILIVDDEEINRQILCESFKNTYDILEAENGKKAIELMMTNKNISAALLDINMPDINGLQVLEWMNKFSYIDRIPVFIITAEDDLSVIQKAYNLGAVDVISKPLYIIDFIRCRIGNVIELYDHRNNLENIVDEQVKKINSINQSLIETLASLIEFRNCESGEHVRRISSITRIIMTKASEVYPEYYMPKEKIEKIVAASILHDVGKISIPDTILNKPGKFTPEEFEIMKTHTTKGCAILTKMLNFLDKDTYKYSMDICRQHHERWDGKGYPEHLAGDDISIWAQIVSIADVYDALTNKRCYKEAFSHEKSIKMIYHGFCGTFNPKLLDVLEMVIDEIKIQDDFQKARNRRSDYFSI